jgi:signal transduction histidine kinase
MKSSPWQSLKAFPGLLAAPRPEPSRHAERIVSVQRRFVLPVRAGVLAAALYFVFSSDWHYEAPTTQTVVVQTLRGFFLVYILCNAIASAMFFNWKRFAPALIQWVVFVLGLLDGLFVAGLILLTDGMESIAYWIFPILIVLNAISIPLAMPQIVLNLLLSVFYLGASILYPDVTQSQNGPLYVPGHRLSHAPAGTNAVAGPGHSENPERNRRPIFWDSSVPQPEEQPSRELFLLRLFVLWLLTVCCCGVQALAERQRRELEEAREFAVRESQLHSAGRLAAEFAHQIKNPLAVIANATYSLQRSLRENKNSAAQQIEIIQEEVARADQVVTQIMGYAELSEGRVEKLDVVEELESAITQVFPPAVPTGIIIQRQYADYFPPLLMQRGHLREIFVNLLTNARDATGQGGNISIKAACQSDYAIEVSIRDNGPGIPPDKITRIFEAYYTTKTKGSGMGLAIVKHNADLYGGNVRVKSEIGKGAEFVLTFPAKAIVSLHK